MAFVYNCFAFIGQGVDLSLYGGLEPYHLLLLGTFWQFGHFGARQEKSWIISQSLYEASARYSSLSLLPFLRRR